MNQILKKIVLENSVKHKGRAELKFVLGSVLKDFPEFRDKRSEISLTLSALIKEINTLSLEQQTSELLSLNPDFFQEKSTQPRDVFSSLLISNSEKVVSCFPPGPEKYPHIGHSKALLLNYFLAKRYNGEFYLRFEDTNPKLVKPEFYKIMQEDFKWLGVSWSKVVYASDYISLMKEMAEKLILKSQAYVCFCSSEVISKNRELSKACECRFKSFQENLIKWKEMESYEEGRACLRLKIDLKHKNSRMRDPAIFRIIDAEHPRIGYQHRNYPTYDFQNAVLDGYLNTTHRLRTLEFEMASELHHYIRKLLNLHDTKTYEFSRFNLKGMLSSGRLIREKIESGELIGWDDPSLPTLRALKRRGFTPEAITQLVLESGISKASGSFLTWDTLIKYNKRVLNDSSKRFFFINHAVKINIKNDACQEYSLPLHPKLDLGKRSFFSKGSYLVEKKDFEDFKQGDLVRLMDNLNFKVQENGFVFHSLDYMSFKNFKTSKKIIHFLPDDASQLQEVTIFTPEHETLKGFAEKHISCLKVGDIIQFERFGFVRLDSIKDGVYNFWFTH